MTQKINQAIRKKVNSGIYDICKKYYREIPLEAMFEVLELNGLIAIAEDGSKWAGFLCGREGNANIGFKCSNCNLEISNSMLVLSWYKMTSGNYEVNAYIS
jgi:hypothetical protein